MKNMSPTFTSDVEGPPLMAPKKEENTFEILWNSPWMLKIFQKWLKEGSNEKRPRIRKQNLWILVSFLREVSEPTLSRFHPNSSNLRHTKLIMI